VVADDVWQGNTTLPKQTVTILGSTGSIGRSALDIISHHPDQFQIEALTAYHNWELLWQQCQVYSPQKAVLVDGDAAEKLSEKIRQTGPEIEVLAGTEALNQVAASSRSTIIIAGIVGAAGLASALAGVRQGKRVLIANKEPLVMAGRLFMAEARAHDALLLPVDSEHNAIFQCLPNEYWSGVSEREVGIKDIGVTKILLTGSGGPFLTWSTTEMAEATPEAACRHPNWTMGRKISVDSATLMNKGLEVIEACHLFHCSPADIEVVIHPQSIIHSMVAYVDGSVLAQMGLPDMRTPLANALTWPQRITSGVKALDLLQLAGLSFSRPDERRFPCLRLARSAAERGGTAPVLLNAANEVVVHAFLEHGCRFVDIPRIIEQTLEQISVQDNVDLDGILEADRCARSVAQKALAEL